MTLEVPSVSKMPEEALSIVERNIREVEVEIIENLDSRPHDQNVLNHSLEKLYEQKSDLLTTIYEG